MEQKDAERLYNELVNIAAKHYEKQNDAVNAEPVESDESFEASQALFASRHERPRQPSPYSESVPEAKKDWERHA